MTPWTAACQPFPVPNLLSGFSQVHVHWIGVAIQASYPLLPSSPSTDIVAISHSVALLSPNSRPRGRIIPSWGAWLYLEKCLDKDSHTCNKSKIDFPGVQEVELIHHMIQSMKMQKQKRNERKIFPEQRTWFHDSFTHNYIILINFHSKCT